MQHPPLSPAMFISDAAGAALYWQQGQPANISVPYDRGVASVGFKNEDYSFLSTIFWPPEFLNKFASQSMLLESIGLLLPFLCTPCLLPYQSVLLYVDNEALTYAWAQRMSTKNPYTTMFLQTLHMIEAVLPCRIFIQHQRRRSTGPAELVDNLSRKSTTTALDRSKLGHLPVHQPLQPLKGWLDNPTVDWDLPGKIVEHILAILRVAARQELG
jgi:hypothetical protein